MMRFIRKKEVHYLFLISVLFFGKCNGKSRSIGPYQYRSYFPFPSSAWRGYGNGAGGVLGGMGGEHGDLSYRSTRKAEEPQQQRQSSSNYYSPRWQEPRSARETSYWNSYYKPASYACEFSCDDGTCLRNENRCDGYAHCWDGSDERGCACKDVIGEAKICDGYKDCPGGKDEEDCIYGCQPNEFTCDTHNSGSRVKCVSMTKRCDGYSDCPQGNDEHECFRMVDLCDDETRGVMSKGILQKRLNDNQWHTVCKTSSNSQHITQFAEKACQQIIGHVDGGIQVNTKSLSQLKQQMSKLQKQQLKYIQLAEIESKFAILGACASDLVYEVECSIPKCGGHGNYYREERRRRRRRSVEDDLEQDEEDELSSEIEFDDEEEELDESDQRELIVGGYATEEMQWPFLVGIFRDGEFYCGGSIINKKWVLTAAHCTHGFEKHIFEVQAGMVRRLSWSPYEMTRMVEEIVVHEKYNSKIFANDIALFKLDKPLHFSKYVTPACLPEANGIDDPVAGQGCRVAGWGDLAESGHGPDHMQEVELPILGKCQEKFTRDSHQICAGYVEGGKDACQGDSGGPLMCFNSANKPIVNGIVSFGRGCARAQEAGAYTRVSAYLDWIDEVITGKHSHSTTLSRPKQCTERCFKPGGECIHPGEKCSGKVECMGAEDELGCTHYLPRSRDDSYAQSTAAPTTTTSTSGSSPVLYPPYWSSYPVATQQIYQVPVSPPAVSYAQSPQQYFGTISRARQNGPILYYYPILPPPSQPLPPPPLQPPQQSYNFPTTIASRASTSRSIRKVLHNCQAASEFQCTAKVDKHFTECAAMTKQCDRSFDCTDQSDEVHCITVTTNFREPLNPLSIPQMKEMQGYVLTRFQGNEWHPVVANSWTLSMGQQACELLMSSDSAKLKSLETIRMEELVTLIKRQTGVDLMEGEAIKLDGNANVESETAQQTPLLSTNSKLFGHPGQITKINMSLNASSSSAKAHLNGNNKQNSKVEEKSELLAGFVRCAL